MESNADGKRGAADETSECSDKKRQKSPPQNSFASLRNEYEKTTPWRGNVDAKINSAAPYNFFLTRVKDIKETYDEDLSISFLGKTVQHSAG